MGTPAYGLFKVRVRHFIWGELNMHIIPNKISQLVIEKSHKCVLKTYSVSKNSIWRRFWVSSGCLELLYTQDLKTLPENGEVFTISMGHLIYSCQWCVLLRLGTEYMIIWKRHFFPKRKQHKNQSEFLS